MAPEYAAADLDRYYRSARTFTVPACGLLVACLLGFLGFFLYIVIENGLDARGWTFVAVISILILLTLRLAVRLKRTLDDTNRLLPELAQFKGREMVLTPDHIDIFTGVLQDGDRNFFVKRGQFSIRLPWRHIQRFGTDVWQGRVPHNYYVIESNMLDQGIGGMIRVDRRYFMKDDASIMEHAQQYGKKP